MSESEPARHRTTPDLAPGQVAPAGQFRLYLGMAAGVGKTCAMLDEGWRRHHRGTDVVIGFVETHGRAQTASLVRDLEVIPRTTIAYRGARFEEMDLDAVLARRPQVVLVDELAHTNVPSAGRHDKRWQDVLELLEAGIGVISTVNIQHLESMADAVEEMTGTTVAERVPDWVVRRADQLELVDSSPEQLRRRLLHGNVYPAEKVPVALERFFRRENLTALRELALRFVADETDEDMLEYLRRHRTDRVWETRERIMVAAGGHVAEHVIRRASRMATRAKGELLVAHVRSPDAVERGAQADTTRWRQVAEDVGGSWHEIIDEDPAQALVTFAAEHQVTQIVLGSSRQSRWEEITGGSVTRRVVRAAARAGVDVHIIARPVDLRRHNAEPG